MSHMLGRERKELEDAAALLLNLEGKGYAIGDKPQPCSNDLKNSVTPRPTDFLATLASLASQQSPMKHASKLTWQEPEPDRSEMSIVSESATPDLSPMRRPRSNSEPWAADWRSVQKDAHSVGGSVILPFMLEKYADTYNRNGRIGIYTRQERDAIIRKFLAKRKRRVWKKKIRYYCRKSLADRRVRVKGRFVKMGTPGDSELNESETQKSPPAGDDVQATIAGESDEEPQSTSQEDNLKNEINIPTILESSENRPAITATDVPGMFLGDTNVHKRQLVVGETHRNTLSLLLEHSIPPVKRVRRYSIAY